MTIITAEHLTLIKIKRELFILSGMTKALAYLRSLESVELETGADLSEFKVQAAVTAFHKNYQGEINQIVSAIEETISSGGFYKVFRDGAYALNRDILYEKLDARNLHRKDSLEQLYLEGILQRGNCSHFTKTITVNYRSIRAVFVKLSEKGCANP